MNKIKLTEPQLDNVIKESVRKVLQEIDTKPRLNESLEYDDYLHGSCHQWVLDNYMPGDKIFVITDYDYDIEDYALVHCGIYRDNQYIDVRGCMDDIDEVLEEFDYGEEMEVRIMSFSEFISYCKENDLVESKKKLRKTDLKNIINECVDRCLRKYLNENSSKNNHITLYHCFDGKIDKEPFIWLSTDEDKTYGKKIAEFSIPLGKLKLANQDVVIENYIKKYDIRSWQEAMEDEFVDMGLDCFDWEAYQNGEISDEQAYVEIPYASWAEVMEHPEYYTFMDKMKRDGFDGYYFEYLGYLGHGSTYYLIFDIHKVLPKYLTKIEQ